MTEILVEEQGGWVGLNPPCSPSDSGVPLVGSIQTWDWIPGGVPGSQKPRKHGGNISRNRLEVVVKADNVPTLICIRLSHPQTLPYPVSAAAELSGGSFFKHRNQK